MKCTNCGTDNPTATVYCTGCGARLKALSDLSETKPIGVKESGYAGLKFPPKYHIVRKIDEGGMGEVYEALDKTLQRTVALKFLSPRLTGDPTARKQFIREARAASKLDHPNICTIYEVDETEDDNLYISMAYYDGETLRARLEKGAVKLDDALDILIPVARGLARAHAEEIVHRDIKPSNIFLVSDGQVKILDFGLAKLATESGEVSMAAAGTVLYMSPEQVMAEGVDQRTDIWSFGVVLYEMLTGRPPFRGNKVAEVMDTIVKAAPDIAGEMPRGMPIEVERIITRSLAKEPAARYQKIDDLLSGLIAARKQVEARSRDRNPSIAVLPFTDMSMKKDQEYFCDGIAEELTNGLARIRSLHVVSRTSAFKYKDSALDIRDIGRELGADSILEGSVRRAGEKLRITAQLVSVSDGYHLWSNSYDIEMQDVLTVQEEISRNIVGALRVTLTPEERQSISTATTTDAEAYDYYLRGRSFYDQFRRKGVELALQMFELAIKHDPNYALAYAGIADCCVYLFLYAERRRESMEQAEKASRKALELGPLLARAHASRGQVLSLAKKHTEAQHEFETAIRLEPELFEAYYLYARDCFAQGKIEKAIGLFEKASDVNPEDYQSPLLSAPMYEALGQKSVADASRRKGIKIVTERLRLNPGDVRALYMGANGLVALGEVEKALEWASLARVMEPNEPMVLYNVACIYSVAGKIEEALDCLEKAAETGLSQREWYEHDSDLDPLRDHPRFKVLLDRLL
jgi:serine/threonine protein kinase/tetratricopeptide (TPR) repeat protein